MELIIEKPGALSGNVIHGQYELPVKKCSIKAMRNGNTHIDKSFTSETGEFYLDAF